MAKCMEAITRRHSNKLFRRVISITILFAVTYGIAGPSLLSSSSDSGT